MILIEGVVTDQFDSSVPIYHWNGAMSELNVLSLPEYVEKNADRLRKKYIDFIDEMGKSNVNGYRLNDEFIVYRGHSLWSMSTLVEKNLVKSPTISDCIKLFALEELLLQQKVKELHLHASNYQLTKAIKILCNKLAIKIIVKRYRAKKRVKNILKTWIPTFLQGLFYLIKEYRVYLPLFKQKEQIWHAGERQIFIFSHLINFELPKNKHESIYSRYWETLPFYLNKKHIKINFLNHFYSSKLMPSIKEAIVLLDEINSSVSFHGEIHHCVPFFLDSKRMIRVLLYYFSVHLKRHKFISIKKKFGSTFSKVNFWFLLENDWNDSMQGAVLMHNLLFIESIENYLRQLPKQQLGLYLQENNGWERAFIKAWKKYQQAELIGVAHTVIRYWDLRYYDLRSSHPSENNQLELPVPDYIAVNGPVAENMLLEADYPKSRIIQVEALRYLDIPTCIKKTLPTVGSQINVLVCGDIDQASTAEMLTTLASFINQNKEYASRMNFTYKSHPVNDLSLDSFALSFIQSTNRKISDIIHQYHVAVVSDSTTVGVEAYLAGLDVIVFSYPNRLNFSPLRNVKGVFFAKNVKQLTDCLNSISLQKETQRDNFFWHEPQLPKWNQLISKFYN
ncbi:MAG: hypothetical protein MH132_10105 [Hydrotalea sp.]|nr:hypothetical protein [Hydrotalea sp.]